MRQIPDNVTLVRRVIIVPAVNDGNGNPLVAGAFIMLIGGNDERVAISVQANTAASVILNLDGNAQTDGWKLTAGGIYSEAENAASSPIGVTLPTAPTAGDYFVIIETILQAN